MEEGDEVLHSEEIELTPHGMTVLVELVETSEGKRYLAPYISVADIAPVPDTVKIIEEDGKITKMEFPEGFFDYLIKS